MVVLFSKKSDQQTKGFRYFRLSFLDLERKALLMKVGVKPFACFDCLIGEFNSNRVEKGVSGERLSKKQNYLV